MITTPAIIFDMDGVIVDTNPYHKIALRIFCEKYGYPLSDEQLVNKIYGRTNKEWIANLFERPLTKEELSTFGEEKEKIFRDLYLPDISPLPGLEDFLIRCRDQGIPVAIGTSAPRSNVDFVLDHTSLRSYFGIILDESDVIHGKPNPEIYINVAKRLNASPNRCIVFEDSLSGVAAAQAAGSKVVGVTTTHKAVELARTDFVINDFTSLDPVDLIERLFPT